MQWTRLSEGTLELAVAVAVAVVVAVVVVVVVVVAVAVAVGVSFSSRVSSRVSFVASITICCVSSSRSRESLGCVVDGLAGFVTALLCRSPPL
jgi:hypothetical protein